jgi:hypothetical protein
VETLEFRFFFELYHCNTVAPWPTYEDERRTRFAKTYGVKLRVQMLLHNTIK